VYNAHEMIHGGTKAQKPQSPKAPKPQSPKPKNPKTQKPKKPKTQKAKNPKSQKSLKSLKSLKAKKAKKTIKLQSNYNNHDYFYSRNKKCLEKLLVITIVASSCYMPGTSRYLLVVASRSSQVVSCLLLFAKC
jgi:hypothetical protein